MHLRQCLTRRGIFVSWLVTSSRTSGLCRKGITALALTALSAGAQAPLDIRVALVIGNAAYEGKGALANPVHDAKAMADTLKHLGFSVVELRDAGKSQMSEAIDKVRTSLNGKQGVGMLYYAGHGLQLDWHNYMVPVDARLWRALDVPAQAIDVNAVIDAFKSAGNRMNIVVLDACRDSPFASTGAGKGLAQQDAPPGTFLAYATAPGNVAEDGDERTADGQPGNGLYTQYLLLELRKPIAKIEDVFKRVRLNVRQRSQGRQIPWESTSLEDDFYFNDGTWLTQKPEELERMAALAKAREQQLLAQAGQARESERQLAMALEKERQAQAAAARAAEEQRLEDLARAREAERLAGEARQQEQQRLQAQVRSREEERSAQEKLSRERERQLAIEQTREQQRQRELTQALTKERELEASRQQDLLQAAAALKARDEEKRLGKEQQSAQAFAREKADWDQIKDSKKVDDFYAYLQKYPNGFVSEQAQFRLEQLQKAQTVAVPNRDGVVALAASARRFQLGDELVNDQIDGFTKKRRRTTTRVTFADDNRAEFNQGQIVWDQSGTLLKSGSGSKSPGILEAPADMAVGKKWRNAFQNSRPDGVLDTNFWEYRVQGYDTVTVPAGTFKAYLVIGVGEARGQAGMTFMESRTWFNPANLRILRKEWIHRSSGKITSYGATEAVSYKPGAR